MTPPAHAPADAFFLDTADGPRFCLFHAPSGECRGALVYIHPFAEEMNRSRRMAALQARALAAQGIGVLLLDLHGCGDSAGDFGDASWDGWLRDIAAARAGRARPPAGRPGAGPTGRPCVRGAPRARRGRHRCRPASRPSRRRRNRRRCRRSRAGRAAAPRPRGPRRRAPAAPPCGAPGSSLRRRDGHRAARRGRRPGAHGTGRSAGRRRCRGKTARPERRRGGASRRRVLRRRRPGCRRWRRCWR